MLAAAGAVVLILVWLFGSGLARFAGIVLVIDGLGGLVIHAGSFDNPRYAIEAAAGIGLESLAPGGASLPLWLGVGLLVFLYTLLLVRTRRRYLRVRLTPSTLEQGTTSLPMSHVTSLRPADEEHHGLRVLGDGPVVPRRLQGLVEGSTAHVDRRYRPGVTRPTSPRTSPSTARHRR